MKIETKFSEGSTIWFIANSKAVDSIVQGFKIERGLNKSEEKYETTITYLCNKVAGENVNIKVMEENAFASKEELLKSL